MFIREKTIAFTGHRPSKITHHNIDSENLLNTLAIESYNTVSYLCDKGYDTFLTGMAEGFDLIAANAVMKAKNNFPNIKLIAVIPFPNQELYFSSESKESYNNILQNATDIVVTSEKYHKNAFLLRNDFLLANSSTIISYYVTGTQSGTMYTINRANNNAIPVFNLYNLIHKFNNNDTPELRNSIRTSFLDENNSTAYYLPLF